MTFSIRIEDYFSKRFGSRSALYVPSGRFGLWLAARHTLVPGSRVLLTPVTCEQVLFALLAAGMMPVFGPVDPATGNLAPTTVSSDQWKEIDAVLTTNLYGMPDDVACLQDVMATYGIRLIEDACHAFDSSVNGKQTGSFGDCAVFSLAKHVGGAGGVLLFRDERDRAALLDMLHEGLSNRWENRMRSLGNSLHARLFGRFASPLGVGHRSAIDRAALEQAIRRAPDIRAFDIFLGGRGCNYRCLPTPSAQAATLAALENWDYEAQTRKAQVRSFLKNRLMPADVAVPFDDSTPLRLPLFVNNREETIAQLGAQGIYVSLVYDPPLHELCPWLPSMTGPWTAAQSRWCGNVLPLAPAQLSSLAVSGLARAQDSL